MLARAVVLPHLRYSAWGSKPALAALCLYSLLPVVLNTFTGIRAVNPIHLENARAFGLNRRQVLFRVVLPLASPTLLAGIKTATIVSIGTATLAALVGAGLWGAHSLRSRLERCAHHTDRRHSRRPDGLGRSRNI